MDWYAGKKEEAEKTKDASAEMHDDDTANRVETLNNRIYFYSEVTRTKILTLNKKLTSLNISLANQVNTLDLNYMHANIRLYINSFGGSVFAGFSAVDYIKKSKIPVETIIDGCAASAATMMSIVAQRRYMNEHAFMLIHQLSSTCWGTYEEMKDDMENNDLLMKTIKQIYVEHTKIPKKKLNEVLKRDLWWDAKTCLEYGLIDEII
jgi:ATP-dependent Clp endopeptidase proteolytic subunit ClpP